MPSPDESDTFFDPEVLAARGKVELAKAELESRLYQAGDSGKRALSRMARKATPVVVIAAVAIGAVALVRMIRARSRVGVWQRPRQHQNDPSLFKVALGAALRAAVRVLAARAVEQAAARLVEKGAGEEPELDVHDFDERSAVAP
ncbi:MAG TPA: hypothetical protein VMS65_13120 [Polyangiaceae bacterium]|nr:hypothetical protein [Polyangiaceae bacterium]